MFLLSRFRQKPVETYHFADNLPFVSVIMPLHNEEKVIEDKIDSLDKLNYPKDKIRWYIGSDASTDQTNKIIKPLQNLHDIHLIESRTGKPGMVNYLVKKAFQKHNQDSEHILLFTDASVMLDKDCLFHLIKYFKDDKIALVDANMINKGLNKENISVAESQYVSLEVNLKQWESKVNRKMIGPFGGCFALRSSYFTAIPDNFLVDDFYICMEVFRQQGDAINSLEALSYETVSQEIKEEFRRKSRIAAGNLQNQFYFNNFFSPSFRSILFAVFSHKILRWYVPVITIILLLSLSILSYLQSEPFTYILVTIIGIISGIPLLEFILNKFKIVVLPIKNLNYFIWMNVALLTGFINYFKGIRSNVWQPTKRY